MSGISYNCSDYAPDSALVQRVEQYKKHHKELNMDFVDIPLVEANADNLKGYGRIIHNFDDAELKIVRWPAHHRPVVYGQNAGLVEGTFSCWWDENGRCFSKNDAVHGEYLVGSRHGDDLFVDYANYHPDGDQMFYNPDGKPFILVLSSKKFDDVGITPLDFVGFYCDGSAGVLMEAGVWHQAAFPIDPKDRLQMRNKQGKVHGVVEVCTLKEFGVHLRIENAFRSPAPLVSHPARNIVTNGIDSLCSEFKMDSNKEFKPSPDLIAKVDKLAKTENGVKFIDIPVVVATEESIKGFGHFISDVDSEPTEIVPWPAHERKVLHGNEGGGIKGDFEILWNAKNECHAVNKATMTGDYQHCIRDVGHVIVEEANFHPDGCQMVHSHGSPFMLVLSAKLDELNVTPMDFVAFKFDGSMGFSIHPNVWHTPSIPTGPDLCMANKQGAVHACVMIEFVKEFGVHVRIPNVF